MITGWQRFVQDNRRALDALLVVLLVGVSVPGSMIHAPGASEAAPPLWPAVVLVAVGSIVLLWRRSHPRTVAVLTGVCGITVAALGYLPSMFVLGPLIVALYTLADRTNRKTANTIAFITIAAVVGASSLARPHWTVDITVIAPAASLLLPLAVGTTARIRRDYIQAVHARAEYAEQTREQEARHRVADERMRIARELHDAVAHHLALANAQAGTLGRLMRSRPEQAEQLVGQLANTTSTALRELKATVGLLRQADDPDAPLHPAPGLAQLPELTASFATAGLTVTTETEGEPRPLSPGTDLTVFRIVQEALTNVAKHAATKAARVHVAYARERLTVAIVNDAGSPAVAAPGAASGVTPGPWAAATSAETPGGGFGLIGMRERAQSIGGTLNAGPRPEGGYQVVATLPLYPQDPQDAESTEEDSRP
jgi:signal transduction histidine kinase